MRMQRSAFSAAFAMRSGARSMASDSVQGASRMDENESMPHA